MAQTAFGDVIGKTVSDGLRKQGAEIAGGQSAGPGRVLQTKAGLGMVSLYVFQPRLKALLRLAQPPGTAFPQKPQQQG